MPKSLKLDDVPDGASLFVDSNIFIYHFTGVSPACHRILQRAARGAVHCIVSLSVLLEVAHRLMILEAQERGLVRGKNPAQKLSRTPQVVRKLHLYEERTLSVPSMGVSVEHATLADLRDSFRIRRATGLLTLDSLSVAVMQRLAISNIASADKSFAKLEEFALYEPGDIA